MIEVRVKSVGPWQMNAHVLVCSDTGQSVLVDPGADVDDLVSLLGDSKPQAILITHTHGDHIQALDEARARLGVPVWSFSAPHYRGVDIKEDRTLADGEVFALGTSQIRCWHTPGHIEDMLCFDVVGQPSVVVGDTIFEGGPGATRSPGTFRQTLGTLGIVLGWADDKVLYPGHGPFFRLGDKRAAIEAFVAKDHGDFFGDATWEM